MIATIFIGVAAAASAPTLADNIDALFLAAQQAEDVGDCVDAGDRYTAVLTLAPGLDSFARTRVEALAKARLVRTAACRAACTVSPSDASLFATAKIAHANNEPKRTAELCAQLLQGKDVRCRGYAEMLAFCPKPKLAQDPCAAPKETRAEVKALPERVDELAARVQTAAAGVDSFEVLIEIDEEASLTHERIVELRERFLRCDGVYAGLVTTNDKLSAARGGIASGLRAAYASRIGDVAQELAALRSEKASVDEKLATLGRLNDEILGDVMKLVQTQAFRTSVVVEGVAQPNAQAEAALEKALKGERETLQALIDERPEFFGDASAQALENKREELARLDMMLGRFARGKTHGVAFEKARGELKQSIVLVDNALEHADRSAHERRTRVWLYVLGLVSAVTCTIVFVRWRRPEYENA